MVNNVLTFFKHIFTDDNNQSYKFSLPIANLNEKLINFEQAELWGQVCELRRQLIDKEHAVLDLQREKKELCREKFELELRLQSSRSERRIAYHPCGQCRPIDSCSCSAPAPLAGGDTRASTVNIQNCIFENSCRGRRKSTMNLC